VEKARSAVERGFDGLRLTGNTFWLEERDWRSFADYEAAVNSVIGQHPMIALCSYASQKCGPHEFLDVVHNHQFALVKREGHWELLASPALQLARQELLEEIAERKQAEEAALRAKETWERTFDAVPDLIAIIDEHYHVVRANRAMAQRLGVTPDECVGKVCFEVVHGLTCAPEFCPHTRTLADGSEHMAEVHEPRIGGEFIVTTTPLVDEQGRRLGSVHVARDITERKRMEEALQNLATLPGENPNPVMRVASDGTVIYANAVSRPLLELWRCEAGASLPPQLHHSVEAAFAAGELVTGETVCEDRTFLTMCAPIAGRDYVNVYGVDITERKRAEEALRQHREDLNRAQAVAHTGSWRLDVRGNELLWSDENHRMFGIPKGTPLTYEAFLATVHPEDREYVDREWTAGLRGEPYDIEHRIVVGETVKWVRERAELEFDKDGTLLGGFGTTQDITERKLAEENIRAQGIFLQRVLDSLRHPFYVVDANDYTIRMANAPTGLDRLPEPAPCYQLFHGFSEPCHGEECECPLQVVKETKTPLTVEHTHRRADGTSRVVEVHCHPLFDVEENVNEVIEYSIDITERKRAEEALERLRTEFMGMVTHELKTPLTAIKGSASMALGSERPLAVEENRELFEIIDEQADRLRELMDNLLDATRIEAGTLSVSPEPTDLQKVLEDARATFARSGGRHEVRLELPAAMPHVNADKRRICQVLANLLNNAAAFSPPIEPIAVAVELDAHHVTVHVRDRGHGISKEKLPLLFKKFSRLHDDRGRKLSGTGLGLAICKGIVEAHGGRIWADSAGESQGSTFSFTLPVAAEVSVKALPDEARRAAHLGRVRRATEKTRVLAVDDEPQILRFLRRSLDEAGYQPIVTADPSEVAKLVEMEEPDLVLLDLMLPGTSGFELLERIREFSGVPVIFLTASDREEDAVRALKEGADDYITKPFSPSELLARIGAALRRRVLPDVMEALPAFTLSDLTIDFAGRRVSVAGQEISLSATEYKILHQLATHAGRPLSYEHLLRQVWGPEYSAETELVRSFIRNLRRKLGDDAQNPRFILTERQVGYRMPKP
jgi:PAS domain S-box-containing protein